MNAQMLQKPGAPAEATFELRRQIPADLNAVEAVALEIRQAAAGLCSPLDAFAVELLVREALTNAVLHGCRLDPEKSASISVRLTANRMVLAVSEKGPGFDWRKQLLHDADDLDQSGRGMEIYRTLADRVRFNSAGNSLALTKSFNDRKNTHG